jgi:hypothetical protein
MTGERAKSAYMFLNTSTVMFGAVDKQCVKFLSSTLAFLSAPVTTGFPDDRLPMQFRAREWIA